MSYLYTIHGRPVSKKNGHRVVKYGGRYAVGNSRAYVDWEKSAEMELRIQRGNVPTIPKGVKVGIRVSIYLAKGQRAFDVDNALGAPMDALEKAGVVKNDRQFVLLGNPMQARDPRNPRYEIEIVPIEEPNGRRIEGLQLR